MVRVKAYPVKLEEPGVAPPEGFSLLPGTVKGDDAFEERSVGDGLFSPVDN